MTDRGEEKGRKCEQDGITAVPKKSDSNLVLDKHEKLAINHGYV